MSTLIDSRLVGQSIKHLRLSKNWTQDRLAAAVGYSVRNLRRIENDGTTSIDVVNTFADIFEVSALDILSGDVFYFKTKIGLTHFRAFRVLHINLIADNNSQLDYHLVAYPTFNLANFTTRVAYFEKSIGSLRHTILTLICYSHTSTPG